MLYYLWELEQHCCTVHHLFCFFFISSVFTFFYFSELIRRYQIQYGGKGDILHCCHHWGYWSFAAGHSAAHEFCWNRVLWGEFINLTPLTVVDHQILLKRLSITYGVHAKALQWFLSYLSDHQQSITTGSIFSKPVPLQSGVPQGSVLGPILFTLYTQSLSDTIHWFRNIILTTTNMQMTLSATQHFKERCSLGLWNTFSAQFDNWVDVCMLRRWC